MWFSTLSGNRRPRLPQSAVRSTIECLEDRSLPTGVLSFADPVDYSVGRSPRSVTVADFNGDQIPDVAVANSGSNNVSILLGNSDGSLGSVGTIAVGTTPSFVTAGDFNGDLLTDLAVANTGSNNVSILLGNGDGSLQLPLNTAPVGQGPSSIAVGDFNGDAVPDVAVANRAASVAVLLGRGDGTFGPASTIGVGGAASFVVAADFDRDGSQDLAVTTADASFYRRGTLAVLLGNGDGTFRSAQNLAVGRDPAGTVVHDFNQDGVADLAVAARLTDSVSILLGSGDGTFVLDRNYQVGGQAGSIAVGDFNGDEAVDLVTASLYSTVSVLTGNEDGTFQTAQDSWGGANPISVAIGDFNRDGRDDLALAQNFSNQVSVLLNNSPQPGDGVRVVRDIVYYDGPVANPQRQNLDVYLPAEGTNFPVVFLTYGGAFRNGEKSRLAYLARTLAREGLGVVAINYRTTDGSSQQVVHPGHVQDVAQAFAWTYRHIAEYGGDPNQIVLMGHSSGGSLVSMLATDRRYLAAQGLSPDVVRGVIGVSSGLYDQRRLFTDPNGPFEDVFGTPEQHWEASPLNHVDGTQPPFLVLYASNDNPGFPEDSTVFYEALVRAGSQAELHMIPGRNHQMIIGNAARPGDPAREYILRFIALHTSWELAHVRNVVINDGAAQRSMVNSLTVTFDRTVSVDSGAFELRRDGGVLVDVRFSTSVTAGKTVAVLIFVGPDIIGGSLADGSYTLTVLADRVHDRWGRELDGDGDGAAGGNNVDGFARLFGDADGDGDVDGQDREAFRSAFGTSAADAGYLWYFDFDVDGDVDGYDNGQFNRRFGQS
jgi:acetyl esterase/lipase